MYVYFRYVQKIIYTLYGRASRSARLVCRDSKYRYAAMTHEQEGKEGACKNLLRLRNVVVPSDRPYMPLTVKKSRASWGTNGTIGE